MKYLGSKARIANEILPIILDKRRDDQWYVEPFAGGMNTISLVPGRRIANDINKYLIAMWQQLINGWEPPVITREEYNQIRSNKQAYPPHLVGWVGFSCSYSGKWFAGFAGPTRTKNGNIRDYQLEARKNIAKQIPLLQGITLHNVSYSELQIPDKSIIYCDPPYFNTTQYLDKFDHDLFWQWIRVMSNNGHTLFVSEYQAPSDFVCVWEKQVSSTLSVNGRYGNTKLSVEKLFVMRN